MSSDQKLLPCPFCGHADGMYVEHVEGTIIHPAYHARCDNCGAIGPTTDKGNHIELWNNRAAASPASTPEAAQQAAACEHDFYHVSWSLFRHCIRCDDIEVTAPVGQQAAAVAAPSDELRNLLEMARHDIQMGRNLKARGHLAAALRILAAPTAGGATTSENARDAALRSGENALTLLAQKMREEGFGYAFADELQHADAALASMRAT